MTIKLKFKRVYGKLKFYPIDETAQALCKIAERTCLGPEQLIHAMKMKRFGAKIEIYHEDGQLFTSHELVRLLDL